MTQSHDPNRQTGEDMAKARAGASVDVEAIRDYLYGEIIDSVRLAQIIQLNISGGRAEWNTHNNVVQVMMRDPVFDKSQMSV
jgi:hypothetical protein